MWPDQDGRARLLPRGQAQGMHGVMMLTEEGLWARTAFRRTVRDRTSGPQV